MIEDCPDPRAGSSTPTGTQIVGASPIATLLVGPDLRIVVANPALGRLLSRDAASAPGGTVVDLVAPEQRPLARGWLARARLSHSPSALPLSMLNGDGAPVDTRWTIVSVGDPADGLLLIHVLPSEGVAPADVGPLPDIETDLMMRVFDATPEPALLLFEQDKTILAVNERWCAATGYQRADAMGARLDELDIWPSAAERVRVREMLTRHGSVQDVEIGFRRRGEATVRRAIISAEVIRARGRAIVLAIGRDVTSEREVEEQRRHAQRLEALGRLATDIAHDFNNLLTVILASGQFLAASFDPADSRLADVNEILKAARSATARTKQLLTFGRKATYLPRPIDVNTVVAELHPLLERLLGPDVRLRTVVARGPALVRADPTLLDQVVVNLAVNARDAMPGGGRLLVAVTPVVTTAESVDEITGDMLPPGRYIRLAVRDTGIGMDDQTRAHLFEPFFTTKGPGDGIGLGLSTVYGIVNQSGGHIRVASAPGKGTTFCIYLPALPVGVPEGDAGTAPRAAG